ncbi:MAG: SpoIIE family protein phosphatase [Myxococcota bacterium]
MVGKKISIAWRIILGTLFTILALLGGFGYLSTTRLTEVYTKTGKQQKEQYIKNLEFAGKAQLFSLARLSSKFIKSSEWNELARVIPPIGREDKKVDVISVFDSRGNLVSFYDSRHPNAKVIKEDKVYLTGDPSLNGKQVINFSGFPWSELLVKKGNDKAKLPSDKVSKPKQIGLPENRDIISRINGKIKTCQDGSERMLFIRPIIEEGSYLGNVAMFYNLKSLKNYEQKLAISLKKDKAEALKNIFIFGAILLALGTLLSIFQGLRITRPIKSLVKSFEVFAKGDLGHRVNIKTNDEVEILGEGFNFMAENLVILLQETEKKAVMAKELEVARTIQETLVPSSDEVHELPHIDIQGHFLPASETGGDWWSYYQLDDNRVLVIIGDVTGHGVPAAMITAAAKSACDTIFAVENLIPDLASLLTILNEVIHKSGKGQFFMTCFASIIDNKNDKIIYANAGHNFPYLFNEEKGKFIQLMARGNRLGEPKKGEYEIKEKPLSANDLIIWYTDGIIEDVNPDDNEYTDKRFRRSIKKHRNKPLPELKKGIIEDAEEFYAGIEHQDDHTMILGKIKKNES